MVSKQIENATTFELKIEFLGEDVLTLRQDVQDFLAGRGFDTFIDGVADQLDLDTIWGGISEEQFWALTEGRSPLCLHSFHLEQMRALIPELQSRFNVRVSLTEFPTSSWQKAWENSFQPVSTKRFYVRAPWHDPLEDGDQRQDLILEPGGAFGTGHHETTRLCMGLLEDYVQLAGDLFQTHQQVCLDIGTGSGILAIAACKLGFQEVWATDIDPEACAVARSNGQSNGASFHVQHSGEPPQETQGRVSCLIANILLNPLLDLLPLFERQVSPQGVLILSGITEDQAPALSAKACELGLQLFKKVTAGGWAALLVGRGQ